MLYKTRLREAVDLQGEWECGVVEISYPQTYYNVKDGELSLFKTRLREAVDLQDEWECGVAEISAPKLTTMSKMESSTFSRQDCVKRAICRVSGSVVWQRFSTYYNVKYGESLLFKTRLREAIDLQSEWECGVAEIFCPKTYYNVK